MQKCLRCLIFVSSLVVFLSASLQAAEVFKEPIVVYSARKDHLIKPLFDQYTRETGVEVQYITGPEGLLLERLQAEGSRTPADMLMTVDAGNLWHAADLNVLSPVVSKVLNENIPAHLRDTKNRWFGLSIRARTVVYSTQKVDVDELKSYADLADPRWKGRLCLRTSKKVYNQSLVAMMIARMGEPAAETVVKGWVDNLATSVFSNDTKLMQAIVAGLCEVGIVNTYYFGRMQKKDPQIPLALFWPNQQESGVHVNISGAGITRYAKHAQAALKLLEWLSGDAAQNLYADANLEYPVNPNVKPHPLVAAWGNFKQESLNVSLAGQLQAQSVKLMDRAGYR